MRVEIKSKTALNQRTGNNGKVYGEQSAALHDGGDFPLPFKLNVEVGREHEPGMYAIAPGCHGTDKFGNLVLARVRLGERQDNKPAAKAA